MNNLREDRPKMLYHNLKYAFRYILRNRTYSMINLAGLSTGLVSCIIIYLILYQEMNYDRFHQNIYHIYLVMQYEKRETGIMKNIPVESRFNLITLYRTTMLVKFRSGITDSEI